MLGAERAGDERVGHLGNLGGDLRSSDGRSDGELDWVGFLDVIVVRDVERDEQGFSEGVGVDHAVLGGAVYVGGVLGVLGGFTFRCPGDGLGIG